MQLSYFCACRLKREGPMQAPLLFSFKLRSPLLIELFERLEPEHDPWDMFIVIPPLEDYIISSSKDGDDLLSASPKLVPEDETLISALSSSLSSFSLYPLFCPGSPGWLSNRELPSPPIFEGLPTETKT